MMLCGMSKKTLAVVLCISSISVMLILNSQLKSTPRSTRYDSRHALSVPLTIDLSKNVTYLRLPDANNEIHRYKLERIDDNLDETEEGGWRQRQLWRDQHRQEQKSRDRTVTDDAEEDEFGDRIDGPVLSDGKVFWPPPENVTAKAALIGQPSLTYRHDIQPPSPNITKNVETVKEEISYLLRVSDPRYPRMIGKVLSRLPKDVERDMQMAIRTVESHTSTSFQQLPTAKQWQVILKVFKKKGYTQRYPDVINIGVKKSGTNALGFFLPEHPQIVHSIGNEVHFFDWMYSKGVDYYLSRMGFAKANQLIFEKTPRYFVTAEVPSRIKQDLPTNPKFILIVRDPISRLISDFRHESELKLRKEFKKDRLKYSLRTGLFEGQRLKKEILDSQGQVNASNELVDTSVYVKHYMNWLAVYPPEQILIIDQDKMEKDVYTEMKRMEKFLGLQPYFRPTMFYNDDRVHGICLRQARHSPRNCPAKSTPSVLPKAELDSETLEKLHNFYRPLNREFARLTGMDFSWVD
ncbi:bifunctional heparan sulfate N-deacetylase/N-sulfotransferase 3-like [Diadema setosum]|uniref:bifunctional heparan sulfate N-deacetylase/N-sulfotransferase 3-like n=1 Tax=Diadema setosum TaxID=31175 RepID=UPI003B3BB66D